MKYSRFRIFLEYIIIVLLSYLILGLLISIIGDVNYRSVLTNPVQGMGFLFCYLWIPIPRIYDLISANESASKPFRIN